MTTYLALHLTCGLLAAGLVHPAEVHSKYKMWLPFYVLLCAVLGPLALGDQPVKLLTVK